MKITKKNLLTLPYRNSESDSLYNSVLFFNSNKKHDSGFSKVVIVGCVFKNRIIQPIEILTSISDDISLVGDGIRIDCFYLSGIFQFWPSKGKFFVSEALSSISIQVISDNGK